jgi:hypothetical protein
VHPTARRRNDPGFVASKSSDVDTDITEDTGRTLALPIGRVDIRGCAIDAAWSRARLMWRKEVRARKPANRG